MEGQRCRGGEAERKLQAGAKTHNGFLSTENVILFLKNSTAVKTNKLCFSFADASWKEWGSLIAIGRAIASQGVLVVAIKLDSL